MFPDVLTEINTDSRSVTQQCCKNLYTPQNINCMHDLFYKSQGVVRDKFFTLLIAKGSFCFETINKKSHLEFLAPAGDIWCMSLVTPYQVIKFWYVVGSLEYEKWKQYQNVHVSFISTVGRGNVLNSFITTTVRTETGLNIMVSYSDLSKSCGYSFVIFYKTLKFCTLKHNSASIVLRPLNYVPPTQTNIKPNSAFASKYLQPVVNFSVQINYEANVWFDTVHCQATCSFINSMPLLVLALHCGRERYLKTDTSRPCLKFWGLKDENIPCTLLYF
jgi:hypothetical protein